MKVLSHSGYDEIKIEVEEMPWWHRIFNKEPRRETYTGHNDRWRDSRGALVTGKKRFELERIWVDLREQVRVARDKARGRA